VRRRRIALGVAGVLVGAFGIFRLLTEIPFVNLVVLAGWLIGAVVIHDGVLSPLVLGVGVLVSRIPPRARRYVQFGLVVAGLVTVIAVPLIARRHSQPTVKAILLRNYAGGLTLLLGVIAAVMATLGDLCESVIKRDLGIKDMSQVIPGHGGLMDRLDSLLATVAPIWLVLHYLVFT